MLKVARSDWDPWPTVNRKSSQIWLKLFVSALLMGVSFRLLFLRSSTLLPVSESPAATKMPDYLPNATKERCDIFAGRWIPNPSGVPYTNKTCHFIEDPQNCLKNGRPDTGYLYWRWEPYGCSIPPFDGVRFLDSMRNKAWALIGDSILRNHVQSLICLLAKAEDAIEVYHDSDYKSRKWLFPSHNFTLSLVWAPFLVKAEIFENDDGQSDSEIQLHLDTLDHKWTDIYHDFDYIVISTGQWFLKTAIYWDGHKVVGCHYCPGKNLTELGFEHAYRKSLGKLFDHIARADHKPLVVYRTWTPDHFENGEWFSGGTCNRSVPYNGSEYGGRDVDHLMRNIELQEFQKAKAKFSEHGIRLKLLDTYNLSLQRPDGHPGPYRTFHPFDRENSAAVQNDCLHWCLPGPIDAWNDLLMELVLNDL